MSFIRLSDVNVGDKVTVTARIVTEPSQVSESLSKNGKPFVRFYLKDSDLSVKVMMFDTTQSAITSIPNGSVVTAEITCDMYNNAPSYKVTPGSIQVTDLDPADFVASAPLDISMMFDYIINTVQSYRKVYTKPDGTEYIPLADATVQVLTKYQNAFCKGAAAVSMHHSYYGGLIYHTYRMLCSAEALLSKGHYANLDAELTVCGIVLHDIGKVLEYHTSDFGDATISFFGQSQNHMIQGYNIVRSIRDVNPLKLFALSHIVLSHHGQIEWGAVTVPMLPEAVFVHMLDNLDAKLTMFDEVYSTMEDNTLSEKIFGLDSRVYKLNYDTGDVSELRNL